MPMQNSARSMKSTKRWHNRERNSLCTKEIKQCIRLRRRISIGKKGCDEESGTKYLLAPFGGRK